MFVGVPIWKVFMFQHRNYAPFVSMVILKKSISVGISPVLVMKYPGKLM